jgi:hypothetical protein
LVTVGFATDLKQTLLDKHGQIYNHLIRGTLSLEIFEKNGGSIHSNSFIYNVNCVGCLGSRASSVSPDGKNWNTTSDVRLFFTEA